MRLLHHIAAHFCGVHGVSAVGLAGAHGLFGSLSLASFGLSAPPKTAYAHLCKQAVRLGLAKELLRLGRMLERRQKQFVDTVLCTSWPPLWASVTTAADHHCCHGPRQARGNCIVASFRPTRLVPHCNACLSSHHKPPHFEHIWRIKIGFGDVIVQHLTPMCAFCAQ